MNKTFLSGQWLKLAMCGVQHQKTSKVRDLGVGAFDLSINVKPDKPADNFCGWLLLLSSCGHYSKAILVDAFIAGYATFYIFVIIIIPELESRSELISAME